jgi:hypothetical protein
MATLALPLLSSLAFIAAEKAAAPFPTISMSNAFTSSNHLQKVICGIPLNFPSIDTSTELLLKWLLKKNKIIYYFPSFLKKKEKKVYTV